MNATRLFCCLIVLLVTSDVVAQDDDEDAAREVDAELAESERDLKFAREHVEFLAQRIERLRKLRMTRMSVARTKQVMKKAEDDGDEELVDELDDRMHELELDMDLSWSLLELNDERWRVREVRGEITRVDPLFSATERLHVLQRERIELTEKLFRVYREGPEADERPLEERAERLSGVFGLRFAHLELSREIEWAREEGEDDAVEELKEVLRELRDLDEEPEKLDRPAGNARALQLYKTAGPVMLSDAQIAAAGNLDFTTEIIPLLKTACFECHDQESASGDLNLQLLVSRQPLLVNRSHWINVIAQLRNRSMPPAEEPQPNEADRRRLVAYLSNAIHNFDYATVRQPGFESARRLTHEEYNNTVRDLFGVDLRPADDFPVDLTASGGFDNSANSLFIQPITMERYVGAAEDIIRSALPEFRAARNHQKAYDLVFGVAERGTDASAARSILNHFVTRAFRRPVADDEVDSLFEHYQRRVADGAGHEAAIREVLQIVLVSPSFLVRTEWNRDTDKAYTVDDWELASRLSYFLWASMPDDELFGLAREGKLHQAEVLNAQISRMLADSRADSLGSQFAAQWLGFNDLGRVRPGPIDNPWCTDSLIAAMQDESAMFFTSLVRDNDSIERIVTADYTFLNQELARHYGMKNVTGPHMRRVSMQTNTRGGIFGQGSILAVTSFPGRTSPVIRGNWILSTLLGTPPPSPPPNVSEFDDRIADNRKLTQRQKMELHRTNPNCYACHSQIDPLGFSLQQFDWFGRYRTKHRGKDVDDRGELPDGTEFRGVDGLRGVLVDRRLDDLVFQITRKMLTYAIGRQLEYYDEATVREIVAAVQDDDRKLQTLIREIVHSDTFRMKQIPFSVAAE